MILLRPRMLRYRVDIIFKQEQNIVVLLRVLKSNKKKSKIPLLELVVVICGSDTDT